MTKRMWSLAEFRFDEGIDEPEVFLSLDEFERMTLSDALDIARARKTNVVADYPIDQGTDPPSCHLSKVTLPLRWERVDFARQEIDERLWFEASCGSRDFLDGRNPHTFLGRISAWCPHQQVGYNVSLAELAEMSSEARYFVKGFLSGTEPSYPADDEGETNSEDMEAWSAATARFRRTGYWVDSWQTCDECGCVLLPGRRALSYRCAEHQEIPPTKP